jgi:hypothetical protein
MNIGLIIGFIAMFLAIFGGGAFMVSRKLKKLDEETPSAGKSIDSAQDFLPFKEVKDGVIDLGCHEYRAIIECSSTNYTLKTENEKNMIEASFQRFVNSLTFPITIFIQTKTMNNAEMLRLLKKEINDMCEKHPALESYGKTYYQEMINLENYTENNRQKKKYIIVPYDESDDLAELNEREKREHSINEVKQRALVLIDALSSMGIKGTLLDTAGIAELVYSSYHKDNYENVKNVINGEFLSLLVSGEKNIQQEMTSDEKMVFIFHEAKKRINSELIKPYTPEKIKEKYKNTLSEIEKLEKKYKKKGE